jgi:hypothetical protein
LVGREHGGPLERIPHTDASVVELSLEASQGRVGVERTAGNCRGTIVVDEEDEGVVGGILLVQEGEEGPHSMINLGYHGENLSPGHGERWVEVVEGLLKGRRED